VAQLRGLLFTQQGGFKTTKSNSKAATIACADTGCSFRINLRAREDGSAAISSMITAHTCGGNVHRTRELAVPLLRAALPELEDFRGQGHRGDGAQVRCLRAHVLC
jgi:hypothetical protein